MNDITAPFVPAPDLSQIVEKELGPVTTHDIIVAAEVTEYRLKFCNPCEKNGMNEVNVPTCLECGCNLSMLTTLSFKSCPLNKWAC